MKAIASFLLVLIGGVTTTANAAGMLVYGNGSDSCGQWTEARKSEPHGTWTAMELSWILGYLTGSQAVAERREGLRYRHADSDAITVWIDNYCQAHPLLEIYEATVALDGALLVK
jgi:hypothetical protein